MTGFIPEIINNEDANYERVFGTRMGAAVNWRPFLPYFESQKSLPYCVTFSRLNCAEAKAKREAVDVNFSDRALAVESGTSKEGNSLTTVSERFRNFGNVLENDCPYVDNWDESVKLPNLTGKQRYYGGSHSWVTGIDAMRSALAYSPLQIGFAVGAEYGLGGVVPPPTEIKYYHAVTLYTISDKGFEIYDSIYADYKTLSLNYPIPWAKSFRDLPTNWKILNTMYTLQRDPLATSEVYAVKFGIVKRHVSNRQTLLLGAMEPDRLWNFAPGQEIPLGNEGFSALPEGAELILTPKD